MALCAVTSTGVRAATGPGIEHSETDASVADTLTICLVDEQCDYGTSDTANGVAQAFVSDVASGQIRQIGQATAADGTVELGIGNEGTAAIAAMAHATGPATAAYASASLTNAIVQAGIGAGTVSVDLTNDGDLALDALATATGAAASAYAAVRTGIAQGAISTQTGTASVSLTNIGDLGIEAVANAYSTGTRGGSEAAFASISGAIFQTAIANGGLASVALDNQGSLNFSASANAGSADPEGAGGGYATAYASIYNAISQTALGNDDVSASLTNSGDLSAIASANASAVKGSAYASAVASAVINQIASGQGDATLGVTNGGTMTIGAQAEADGQFAAAIAMAGQALLQSGQSTGEGDVTVSLVNDGSLQVGASAAADGQYATAVGYIDNGIVQAGGTNGSGNVNLTLANSGELGVNAAATASGDFAAWAFANVQHALVQSGNASNGQGTAQIDNDGSIQVSAQAQAHAGSGIDSGAGLLGSYATATAVVSAAIVQDIQGEAGSSATLSNSGDISIVASAEATGSVASTGTAFGSSPSVSPVAVAVAEGVVYQIGRSEGGDTSVELQNDGDFDILSIAKAESDSGPELALAIMSSGIHQEANAFGDASIDLTNNGGLHIGAQAEATGPLASAIAVAYTAIHQNAFSTGEGDASASLHNNGTLQVSALATANSSNGGYGHALAINGAAAVLVAQNGGGSGDTESTLDNAGAIDVVAVANAEGGAVHGPALGRSTPVGASASAIVTAAVIQGAIDGTNSTVSMTNSGELNVAAIANASDSDLVGAPGFGASSSVGHFAGAVVGGGILQVALGDNASVSLSNEGSLQFLASANAESHGAGLAQAYASMFAAVTQYAGGIGGDAEVTFDNEGSMVVAAQVNAESIGGAVAVGTGQLAAEIVQTVVGDGNLTATLANSGTIAMGGDVAAVADANSAYAYALGGQLMRQTALYAGADTQPAGNAQLNFDNSGSFLIAQHAMASGVVAAAAATIGTGMSQFISSHGDAAASFDNSGSLELHSAGEAHATGDHVETLGSIAAAIRQGAIGAENATVALNNDGDISLVATASAEDSLDDALVGKADARAILGAATFLGFVGAIDQSAFGNDAEVSMSNSGSLMLAAASNGRGRAADVNSRILVGVEQKVTAFAGDAQADFDNHGDLGMVAAAEAEAASGAATAVATIGNGIDQWVNAIEGDAIATLSNSGAIEIDSLASASGDGIARANATVRGFTQGAQTVGPRGSQGTSYTDFNNDGDVLVQAVASALGGSATDEPPPPPRLDLGTGPFIGGDANADLGGGSAPPTADAYAEALGLGQSAANQTVDNGGTFAVVADAEAEGPLQASAMAKAKGMWLQPQAFSGSALTLDLRNSGDLLVAAHAAAEGATGSAVADATGVRVDAWSSAPFSAAIDNSGAIMVSADAQMVGGAFASANAVGLSIVAGAGDLSIDNSGVLMVSASSSGDNASATAILLGNNGTGGETQVTFTNDGGTIIARRSTDGGETWQRGTAIDTRSVSGASVIHLVGNGSIYGNIELASGDIINVSGGETSFNGIIKTDCPRSPCAASILNIGGGGSLFLRHAGAADTPTAVYVNELNIASDGTIIFELPTETAAASALAPTGGYAQIFTDVANLDGTLLLRSTTGLYDDSYLFEDVIDADVRNGQFDRCGIEGDPALLSLSCVYDADGNVDLKLDRVAFNAVAGLSRNQKSVGSGIEAVYDVNLDGDFGDMIGQLFTFDAEGYAKALSQLSGSGNAAFLQSFHNMGVQQNDLIDRAVGCELHGNEASSLSCRTSKISMWGQLDVGNRRNDGDKEAGAYDADRWMAAIGVDAEVGRDMVAGLSLTKVSNRLDFHDGSRWKADGYQLGAYGVLDRGRFYAKAMASYGWFNGDSQRIIDWSDLGGDLGGVLNGKPDARLWTLGARFGYRVPLGETSRLTPYLNVDHSHTTLKGFTETGLEGPALAIEKSTTSRTAVTLGAKWAGDVGGVVPQLELGYRRLFGDRRAMVDASFEEQAGSDFSIVSAEEKRGSLLAGASLGGKVGKFDVRVGYQGLFDGMNTSHSANFRLTLPLGGK